MGDLVGRLEKMRMILGMTDEESLIAPPGAIDMDALDQAATRITELEEENKGLRESLTWHAIETAPKDRYVLLFSPHAPAWDGNMEVGKWYGDDTDGCWWSCGGPNGGLEISGDEAPGHYGGTFTHWMELPLEPTSAALGKL